MNIIINGFHDVILKKVLRRLLNNNIVDTAYLISNDRNERNIYKLKAKVLDFKKISLGNYPVDWEDLIPLDKDLLESMYSCETIALKMIERIEPHIGKLSYNRRKEIYLNHLRYWNHIINTENIKYFVSSNIPHEVYDFVIYGLCKLKEIKMIFLHQTIPGFLMLLKDFNPFFTELNEKFAENLKLYKNKELKLNERGERLLNSQTSKNKDPIPVYMTKNTFGKKTGMVILKMSYAVSKLFTSEFYKNVLNFRLYSIFFFRLVFSKFYKLKSIIFNIYYESIQQVPDFNETFIYFPLHYQPELTTSPLADGFVNQKLIVDLMHYHLPEGVKIYVKEHPKQTCWTRSISFYKELKNLKNVKLISKKFNSFRLIEKCAAVATATGTAGWEAVFRKKPVLLFGNFFYQYVPGVYSIRTGKDLVFAYDAIFKKNSVPDLHMVKIFVKTFEEMTLSASYAQIYQYSNMNEESNSEVIYQGIVKKLEKY